MLKTFAAASLLATVLVAHALAQTNTTNSPATIARDTQAPSTHVDMWRSSKLIGVDVYNDKNDKLGDIRELLLDKSGKVAGVIVGVGGFLGMGEHDIMVEMSKLKFVDEPVSVSTSENTTGANNNAMRDSPVASNNGRPVNSTRDHWYPDHAVLAGATKDSLKAMQQFKY